MYTKNSEQTKRTSVVRFSHVRYCQEIQKDTVHVQYEITHVCEIKKTHYFFCFQENLKLVKTRCLLIIEMSVSLGSS